MAKPLETKAVEQESKSDTISNDDVSKTYDIPKTRLAVVCTKYGDPLTCVSVKEIPLLLPTKNEIMIKVRYCGLNPVDFKRVMGNLKTVQTKTFPWIIGSDYCGIIVKFGRNIKNDRRFDGFKIGTRVCGQMAHMVQDGSFAEYININPYKTSIEIVPDNVRDMDAGALPLAGMTSYQGIKDYGKLKKDDKILILGGSSGCGSIGISIAKALGAKEICCTSSQEEFCKKLGATKVVNYRNAKWEEVLKGENFDVIYDCVGGVNSWNNAPKVLKKNGNYVTIVGDVEHGAGMEISALVKAGASMVSRKFWSLFDNPNYYHILMDNKKGLKDLLKMLSLGTIKIIVDEESPYNLNNIKDMLNKSIQHKAHGKLVLKIDRNDFKPNHDEVNSAEIEQKMDDNNGNAKVNSNENANVNANDVENEAINDAGNQSNDVNPSNDE
eukprot:CAMPEP_0114678412 /NCGR_PEP_ID=MMETSP0191-20121206/51705_1 /TAXON_ID=126664 /ORGANISM="Sorites sp." /LENGTH=438 /DNA_ID=CAMNT_0001952375 /DNA_START=25 /DNA_END=1341 /DNA_ORIENTATION=-